jgi:hypothetical protein
MALDWVLVSRTQSCSTLALVTGVKSLALLGSPAWVTRYLGRSFVN